MSVDDFDEDIKDGYESAEKRQTTSFSYIQSHGPHRFDSTAQYHHVKEDRLGVT